MELNDLDFPHLNALKDDNIHLYSIKDLIKIAKELRLKIIYTQESNGFLGSCLGVVDLTIALHHVFDLSKDKIFWDVGHQKIPHTFLKNYEENKNKKTSLLASVSKYNRPAQGLSESIGQLLHRNLKNDDYNIISIIGDRSLSCGQAFEAMNHIGAIASKKIIILNDNISDHDDMQNTAFSYYLQQLTEQKKIKFQQQSLFECLGFNYIGPIDGHDIKKLIEVLTGLRDSKEQTPIMLHIKTKKGKGYAPAEVDPDGLNSLTTFDVQNGCALKKQKKTSGHVACQALLNKAKEDDSIVLISLHAPHMMSPFLDFKKYYPNRYFEVGVTESHAITLASKLAEQGLKPYLILYSSFLHRVLDHMTVDVCIKKSPIRFVIDHTRFTGHDFVGNTKLFDSNFLSYLPNFTIMAPGCADDIEKMINLSSTNIDHPCVIRLSKTLMQKELKSPSIEIGKARIIKKGSKIAILSYGGFLEECLKAAEILDINGHNTTVVDIRFLKPLDEKCIIKLAKTHKYIISVEENAVGSLSHHILQVLNKNNLFGEHFVYHPLYLTDIVKAPSIQNKRLTTDYIFKHINQCLYIKEDRQKIDFISVA